MRAFFALFLLMHGLAHTIGFLTPWGFAPRAANGAPPPQMDALFGGRIPLSVPMSKALGLLWLIVAVLFAVVALSWWRGVPGSGAALVALVIASLGLSIAWWPVARIGVFINVALLLGLAGTGYRSFSADLAQARRAAVHQSLMIMTALGPMEYATAGQGDPVLVIHGTGGGWDQGLYAAGALAERGFHLISPSRFGYLRTPMPADHSPAAEADAFAVLLDSLGIQRAAVISFSAGAAPSLQFALRHPERVSALVLMVPAAGGISAPTAKGPPAFVMHVVLGSNLPMWLALRYSPRTIAGITAVPYALLDSLPPGAREHYQRGTQMLLPITERRPGMLNDGRNQSGVEPLYPLEQLTVPTMLVSAEDDLYGTAAVARLAATKIANAELLIVRNGGHFLLGHDAEIWPAVASFIRAVR
ncbi:MAG TPA: alpha/beta hydrolase [Gemmatimonadaceae bacterium]|nr:alpha/beta hydrolase [Gemmatimonadaceae bacterium]